MDAAKKENGHGSFFFCRRAAVMFYILLQATPFLDTVPRFLL